MATSLPYPLMRLNRVPKKKREAVCQTLCMPISYYAMELLIGAHTSTAGGLFHALEEGQAIGATTIQLFTSNQRQWKGRTITHEERLLWEKTRALTGLQGIMSHDSYLINLGAAHGVVLEKSREAFAQELMRCHELEIDYLNFHPGAAVGGTEEGCLERIVESLLLLEPLVHKGKTLLVIEATAGQGSTVGCRFEQLQYLVEGVRKRMPIGICLDTCHIFAAGYDIRTAAAWEKTLQDFDRTVGLPYLKAFHLNDSLKELGSRVDRHQPLGRGCIGWEAFAFLVRDPRTRLLPMYLETPEGPVGWKEEITALRKLAC